VLDPSTDPGALTTEERLLRRALETGARVTVVEEASAAVGAGGVAAILRW
jgi:hypothetical protein